MEITPRPKTLAGAISLALVGVGIFIFLSFVR